MLDVKNISVFYGRHSAVEDVTIKVSKGEIVVILGANGAGKSTFLRAVGGLTPYQEGGSISIDGVDITHLPPHEIVEAGIALVPEGRGVFSDLTVLENLSLGANPRRARHRKSENLERVLSLFPLLLDRQQQTVRTMSGGEQQMVAIGRAMMSAPSILMLDEPSLGLSPRLCKEFFQSLKQVRKVGVSILLVEQNAKQSLAIADRGYLLENSRIVGENSAANLMNDPAVQKAYLGVAGGKGVKMASVEMPTPEVAASNPASSPAETQKIPFKLAANYAGRVRTDDLLTRSISDLVQHAAAIQADQYKTERSEHVGASVMSGPGKKSANLYDVLAMIEKAAIDARIPKVFPKSVKSRKSTLVTPRGDGHS